MADIYDAELSPGKLDVIAEWLSRQKWAADVDSGSLQQVTSYRFDDPDGQVGIEIHIVASGDRVLQVPLTYRGAPLESAEEAFVAEMEHSVLGRRWVYSGIGDPVFQQQLDAVITGRGSGARQRLVDDSGEELEEITEVAEVVGTGPLPTAGSLEVVDELDLAAAADRSQPGLLIGTWEGQETPVVLARMI